MYKALIADIDGTLVAVTGDGSEINDEIVASVASALKRGVKIGVATGRGWKSTKPVISKLGIVHPCIIEGGACIIDPVGEEIVWEKYMDAAISMRVAEIFKKCTGSTELIKSSSNPGRLSLKQVNIADYGAPNRIMYMLGTDKETALQVAAAVRGIESVDAHITTPSWAGKSLYDVHVTHKLGTKQYALKEWMRLMQVDKDACVAMGDSPNDFPLFDGAGLRVAVGNATDDLKARADYIAPKYDDALRDVIQKFFA